MLSEEDFRNAHEFVRICELAPDLGSYRSAVLQIASHVPGNITSYNEVDLVHDRLVAQLDPVDAITDEQRRRFERDAHQHPVIAHMDATGDLTPRAISDFLGEDEFHSLDLYRSFFGQVGVEDQIAFGLPGPPGLVLGVAVNRPERGFSARDRSFLSFVAPHVGRAYTVARARARVRTALASAELQLSPTSAVVVLDAAGRPQAVSPVAGRISRAFFGQDIELGRELPGPLATHVARSRSRGSRQSLAGELVVERDASRLRSCFIDGAGAGEPDALLLDAEANPLAVGRIKGLGLTDREAEVVRLLAAGRANAEIALDLGISTRTVQRHLENVYDKLGVRSRAGVLGRLLRG